MTQVQYLSNNLIANMNINLNNKVKIYTDSSPSTVLEIVFIMSLNKNHYCLDLMASGQVLLWEVCYGLFLSYWFLKYDSSSTSIANSDFMSILPAHSFTWSWCNNVWSLGNKRYSKECWNKVTWLILTRPWRNISHLDMNLHL